MALINIAVSSIQGALFPSKGGAEMKVYGAPSPVLFEGSLQAADKKDGDRWVPTAYGRLRVQAAKATSKGGKEYLHLAIEGGLTGRLFKAEAGKDYDYSGVIDAGGDEEFVVFGRRRKSEGGVSFIALNSAERKKKEAPNNGSAASAAPAAHTPAAADEDDIPF
ncbi:MAG: hypothetical protein N2690_00470 [Rhodocyclaceae bacterium]|nr:hypothetical protein [Rhodocyclaceae bacterium]